MREMSQILNRGVTDRWSPYRSSFKSRMGLHCQDSPRNISGAGEMEKLITLPATPWKIDMEPTNHPFRKEIDLNQTFMSMESMFIFQGVTLPETKSSPLKNQWIEDEINFLGGYNLHVSILMAGLKVSFFVIGKTHQV